MDFLVANETLKVPRIVGSKHESVTYGASDYDSIRPSLKAAKPDVSRQRELACDLDKTGTETLVNQKFHGQSHAKSKPSIGPSTLAHETQSNVSSFSVFEMRGSIFHHAGRLCRKS